MDALNVLRDQRNELDEEVAAGRMTEAEREARIAELTRRVHDEGLTDLVVPAADAQPRRRPWLAAAVAVLVPAIALPVYFMVGTPAALDPAARAPAAANSPHGDFTPEQVRELLAKLKARLEANPTDINGWVMLGRGMQLLNEFPASAAAFAKASALKPDDPGLLADYADSLAMAQNRTLKGKPWELVQQALQIDPRLPKALALAATAEYDEGRFASAKGYWQRLLAVLPPDSEDANEIRTMIAQVDGMPAGAAAPALPPVAAAAPAAPAPAAPAPAVAATPGQPGKAITGTVRLAPALAAKAKPGDIVYLFARAAEGSRLPLAIQAFKVSDLPKSYRLDDAEAMSGAPTLASTPRIRVEARVSKSGDARAAPGDLRGESAVIALGATQVNIVIGEEITASSATAAATAAAAPPLARPPAPSAPAAAPAAATPAAQGKAITGVVRLAPALAAKAAPDDTLFVFARAAEGSRMPLAILRLKASELPKQFRLDDTLGMTGGPALSATPQVRIEARVSKSGEATPRPGDLRGESAVVAPGAANVEILIDRAVP
ncbi:MAG: c-type cytochrome biogenesis protein CcmI [Betaproteobacteria bacterium]|nr:c-type cytochrome biogenesis protein CcmI [Betaproteobacteria bacterium]